MRRRERVRRGATSSRRRASTAASLGWRSSAPSAAGRELSPGLGVERRAPVRAPLAAITQSALRRARRPAAFTALGHALRSVRLAAALAALLLLPACTPLDMAMHAIFGRSMRDQPSFDPYENPQLPAEGSVPFASGNFPAAVGEAMVGQPEGLVADIPPFTVEMMLPPGAPEVRTLENPVAPGPESLARGEEMFNRNCAVCHGPRGISGEAAIITKLPIMGVYNLATGNATGYSDGYIYGMIRVGRGLMPSYGHRVSHFDRWHIVNYVRVLQQRAAEAGLQAPTAPAAAPGAAGEG